MQSKNLLTTLLFLVAALIASGRDNPPPPSPPNLVFILADDLGYGDLGCYGAPDIRTPNLDRLAAEGMRFTDCYANGAVCSPTRIAFITGRYQQRLGMDNALYYQEMGRGLSPATANLATTIRDHGYTTGLSGKWHIGYDRERQPLQQGFDHFFGLLGGNHHYFEHMDRIGVPDLWFGNDAIERKGYSTDLITDDALAFIDKNHEQRFFLYLSHAAPHFPHQGPDDAHKDIRPKSKNWQPGDRATYTAMVEHMDKGIGEVLDRLDELALTDKTLIVFSSDNGGYIYSRNAPLQGHKSSLLEGGIRVPCIARWPGVIPKNTTTSQVAITMDWSATFAALAGVKSEPLRSDGIDLTPILKGDQANIERTLYWRSKKGPKRKSVTEGQAVRQGRWKWYQPAEGPSTLFDLENDPGETDNLIDAHSVIEAKLSSLASKWEKAIAEGTPIPVSP
jgi:N-acetylgalactosamine-6-sulfatase